MTLSGKEKAALRAEAHHLTAIVHVGKEGVTPTLVQSLDDALRTKELVKIQLGRTVEDAPKQLAHDFAGAVQAEVIQVIGKTMTLYRPNPDIEGKVGDLPPWRR